MTPSERPALVQSLRQGGQTALDEMVARYREEFNSRDPEIAKNSGDRRQRFQDWIDAVAMQKDAHVSGLFWHTDLDLAKARATAQGKPILSLRLLGNLNEEKSCANSRFFRTTLYANAGISAYLRSNYVLHWQSVSPAPRLTIDFGDGRTIDRTITGNSVHYVLDVTATPIEVIPGLISPEEFANKLKASANLAKQLAALTPGEQANAIRRHHRRANEALEKSFANLLENVGGTRGGIAPILAMWKAGTLTEDSLSALTLAQLAASVRPTVAFDLPSTQLISSKAPAAEDAGRVSMSKGFVETPAMKMMRNLTLSVSQDTVINTYLLTPRIHRWFSEDASFVREISALNEQVYTRLFRMPPSDPWLGLAAPDVFSALPANGLAGAGLSPLK